MCVCVCACVCDGFKMVPADLQQEGDSCCKSAGRRPFWTRRNKFKLARPILMTTNVHFRCQGRGGARRTSDNY